MKFKIVFYLFIFVCILLFFQLFNTNKVLNYQDDLIQKQNLTYIKLKDSIKGLNEYKSTNNYFSLTADSNLMKGESNIDLVRLENQLIDVLRGLNSKQGLRKLLTKIPKEGTYLVDQIKVVNRKWVLIGFKSDLYWGQALIEYSFKQDNSVQLKELSHFVNPL
ncbi:MAG: hypothetical protein QNK96_03875 [Flavobacteriia bacterium]